MITIAFCLAFTIVFIAYVAMQKLIASGAELRSQQICSYVAGAAAWVCVLGGGFQAFETTLFLGRYFTGQIASADMAWATVAVVVGGMGVGMIVILFELVASFDFRSFFANSLLFRSYEIQKHDLELELEQDSIYSIYEQQSGEAIPDDLKLAGPKGVTGASARLAELESREAQRVETLHRADELRRLAAGETVDISETWALNRYRNRTHPLYQNVTHVEISPEDSQMSLTLAPDSVRTHQLTEAPFRRTFEGTIIELLGAVISEPWMKEYREYFIGIAVSCSHEQDDAFGHADRIEFLRCTLTVMDIELEKNVPVPFSDHHHSAAFHWIED